MIIVTKLASISVFPSPDTLKSKSLISRKGARMQGFLCGFVPVYATSFGSRSQYPVLSGGIVD